MGGELVLAIFISTAVVFAAYGFIGYRLTKDLGGWANYLFVGVLGLIVVSVFGIFIPFSNVTTMLISMAGVLIFSLYTIYDFNQIRHRKMDDRDIPFVAIGLYLDFLNLFLNLLRLVNALRQ
jgi:FtsH-binding integral membrane protein